MGGDFAAVCDFEDSTIFVSSAIMMISRMTDYLPRVVPHLRVMAKRAGRKRNER